MSGQSGGHRLRLSKLNDQLTCKLCGGYYVDATTIIECLHSFCRSCIVKYLENNKYCPICEVQVHKSRPLLNIRPDYTLQDIVYKLVPGCYQNEMKCRREFYLKHPEAWAEATSPEARGEPTESHIYSPDESLSLSLEYFTPCNKEENSGKEASEPLPRRYLRCPAAVTVFHLQKLIRAKYGLTDGHRVDVMYEDEPLCASYTLMDVMYIYHWRRKVPVHLSYRIFESSPKRIRLSQDTVSYKSSLLQSGIESMECKEEKPRREWKEVQLKISETGVMSITDISDQQFKRTARVGENNGEKEIVDLDMKTSQEGEPEKEENLYNNNVDVREFIQKSGDASQLPVEKQDEEDKEKDGKTTTPSENEQKQSKNNNNNNHNNNNNNNNNIVTESKKVNEQKENAKNEIKIANVGSKIDALSAKLQFQPKTGNTYLKTHANKEKKISPQSTKKTPSENTLDISQSKRNNCASETTKSPVALGKEVVIEIEEEARVQEKIQTAPGHDRKNVDKKSCTPEIIVSENNQSTSCFVSAASSTSNSVTTSPAATSTFPYTVQDLVNSAMLKNSSVKNTSQKNLEMPQKFESVSSARSVPDNPTFSIQSSMSVVSTPRLKNHYPKQPNSKANLEMSGVYPTVPPCPDAIPISLMNPTIRKNELLTKGTNLNEICAKIGASGSKINDICAKIGENSKEKNRVEARSKPEIPDLLKIGRKSGSPSPSPSSSPSPSATIDSSSKQHSTIPNVSVYASNNSCAISTEGKPIYSTVKDSLRATSLTSVSHELQKVSSSALRKQGQSIGYKTLRDPPRCWNPTLSKNNYVAVKNQSKESQNQSHQVTLSEKSKAIQSKPAKIFKMRNMPRYLGNPASGVKPMYGIGNESKEKEQSTSSSTTTSSGKGTSLMMKIDPKTLSPIVSTVNSPIVSPPPYSPAARNYQTAPFSRDICRSTGGTPISPKNSAVNMLSTNPFIPSPTPNTNPRLIYSHFPPPFPDASRFPNPLIRSPIGIPPPSAFHSSLPPSINKLYQRSSYMPQTTAFSQAVSQPVSQPPTVQRIPANTYSSPKSPKATSLTAISPTSYSLLKSQENHHMPKTTTTTTSSFEDNVPPRRPENASQHDQSAFNLSKSSGAFSGAGPSKGASATTNTTTTTIAPTPLVDNDSPGKEKKEKPQVNGGFKEEVEKDGKGKGKEKALSVERIGHRNSNQSGTPEVTSEETREPEKNEQEHEKKSEQLAKSVT